MKKETNKDSKENFCAPCAMAIPAALGFGGVAAGSGSGGGDRKWKTIIFWSSIALILISIIVFIYLKMRCTTCR
jgi:uncharacterized membrane protein YvbJ